MSQKTRLWRGIQTFEERLERWENTSFEALDIESMEEEIVRCVLHGIYETQFARTNLTGFKILLLYLPSQIALNTPYVVHPIGSVRLVFALRLYHACTPQHHVCIFRRKRITS